MREGPDRWGVASQTDRLLPASSAAVLIAAVLAASCCSSESPDAAYSRASEAYFRGDLDKAILYASASGARWNSDRNSPWFWKFRLQQAEALHAESKDVEAAGLLSDPVPARAELNQLEVRRLIDKATLPSDKATAAKLLQEAGAAVTDPELKIRVSLVEGSFHRRESDAGEASFRAALEMANRERNLYYQASALNNLSLSSKALQRYEESIALGLQALDIADRTGARRIAAAAHGNLGSTYALLGRFDLAFEHQEKAIRIFEEIGARPNLTTALGELGLQYDLQGETDLAVVALQKAYDIADLDVDAERYASNLSLALIRAQQWDLAFQWNDRASELARLANDKNGFPYLERNRAQIAYGRKAPELAASICNELLSATATPPGLRWELLALLGKIDSDAGRFSGANRKFEAARKIIEGTRSDLLYSQNRITLLSRLIGFYQDYVDALVLQSDNAGALRVVESSRARVLGEKIGREIKAEEFPNPASLRSLARSTDSSLLTFWIAPKRSFAWLIAANGIQRFDLPPAAEIEQLVTRYRGVVEHSLTDPIASREPSAAALWSKLLADIAPRIRKGSRLLVIPDGPLHRVNLETMVAPTPEPHYWIEDVELAVAPSLTIAASRPAAEPRRAPSLLLIGAPDYSGTAYTQLPKADAELHHIEAHFAGVAQRVITGAQASPAAYGQAGPAGFSLIHFAAHAEANAEKPLESAIVLSRQGGEDKLYARDVIDIPIHADLVTISACRSAGARTYAGEGLIGFAWAFLQAGARDVVAGLWDVSDTSTEALMDRFYAGINSGQDPVTALRSAKLALLKGDERYRKPFYWAPFQAYVGSAARMPSR
jgi:CHAT domain-containing protein